LLERSRAVRRDLDLQLDPMARAYHVDALDLGQNENP
jgi:hypothetical protein